MIREFAVSACQKCQGLMYTEIVDWDDEAQEVILDYSTAICMNGCTSYAVDTIEIQAIVEVEK